MSAATTDDERLASLMADCSRDPLGFVQLAFPWAEEGPLKLASIERWQELALSYIQTELRSPTEPIKLAAAHGNGAGGTTLLCWIALWGVATRVNTRVVITGAPDQMLYQKTWKELAFWHSQLICKHWFEQDGFSLCSRDPDLRRQWRVDILAADAAKPEAFAGLCNAGNRTVILMDNASVVPDVIWETLEGSAVPDSGEVVWGAFGTGSRLEGRFHECFRGFNDWRQFHVDTRDVKIVNQGIIRRWETDYGEDSDWFRVHVRGLFPRG